MSATVTELQSYLIKDIFGDFVSATGREFDDASALSTGLRRVSCRVIGHVAGTRLSGVNHNKFKIFLPREAAPIFYGSIVISTQK